jgi:hypothetical protein
MKIWPMLLKIWVVVVAAFAVLTRQCFSLLDWFLRGGWQAILLLFAAVAGGWYLWRFLEPAWRLAKLRRKRNGDPQQFLVLCYREMERHFALRGTARAPHITPLEYERLLARRFLPLAEQIALVTRLFQQAAYGPAPVAAAKAQEALQAFEEIQRWKDPGRKSFLGMRL